MIKPSMVSVCAVLLSLLFMPCAYAEPLVMTLPNMTWALEIETDGFEVQGLDTASSGEGMRLMAGNEKTGVFMTVFLEKAESDGDKKVCRDFYWSQAKQSPVEKSDLTMSETETFAKVSYLVKEFQGQELNQKNVNAYLSESGYWVDIHLSKVNYTPEDDRLFDGVLKGVEVNKNYVPTSMMCFQFGNLYFSQRNFAAAIPHYKRAVMLEKETPTMEKRMWIVLVDQLGMSYGISGDVGSAKALYQDAIAEEPEVPMFYYNYACAFAESNDRDQALGNLKMAYKYRANLFPGEVFPNPLTDPSFRKLMMDESFVSAVRAMQKRPSGE